MLKENEATKLFKKIENILAKHSNQDYMCINLLYPNFEEETIEDMRVTLHIMIKELKETLQKYDINTIVLDKPEKWYIEPETEVGDIVDIIISYLEEKGLIPKIEMTKVDFKKLSGIKLYQ